MSLDYTPKTLDDWQKFFAVIYGTVNTPRDQFIMWLEVDVHGSRIERSLRKQEYEQIDKHIANLFAWLCGFCSRTMISLEDAVWKRYPCVCPYCTHSPCDCPHGQHPSYDSSQLVEIQNFNSRPATLSAWKSMFKTIYSGTNQLLDIDKVVGHLQEEIGEGSYHIVRNNRESVITRDEDRIESGFKIEVADVFAWLLAVSTKLDVIRHGTSGESSLEELVYDRYPGRCLSCGDAVCIEKLIVQDH